MTTNLNFFREIETKNILKNCETMTPQNILDYLYKYNNMDSIYIYENLPDNVQKEVDKLIVQKLLDDYQKIKDKKDKISKLNTRIHFFDDEMDKFENCTNDYIKLSHVSTSLHILRSKTYDELSTLRTYSKFGPYEIDSQGNVKFDDDFDKIEIYLLILEQRFRKLNNLVDNALNDDDCLKIEEIVDHRIKIYNLEIEIKNITNIIENLNKEMEKARETEQREESTKLSKQYRNEIKKSCDLKDKLYELERNYPTFGKQRIEIILHDFKSLKNRMRKMKNYYPWTECSTCEENLEFDNITNKINDLENALKNWKLQFSLIN